VEFDINFLIADVVRIKLFCEQSFIISDHLKIGSQGRMASGGAKRKRKEEDDTFDTLGGSLGYAERLSFREDLGGQLGAPEHFDLPQEVERKAEKLAQLVRGCYLIDLYQQ
jgi:hypothetical protein